LKDLPLLADSRYEGAGAGVHVPVKKPAGGGELDLDAKKRNALLRSLRYQGERGFALTSGIQLQGGDQRFFVHSAC
jgi:hypothetical protein